MLRVAIKKSRIPAPLAHSSVSRRFWRFDFGIETCQDRPQDVETSAAVERARGGGLTWLSCFYLQMTPLQHLAARQGCLCPVWYHFQLPLVFQCRRQTSRRSCANGILQSAYHCGHARCHAHAALRLCDLWRTLVWSQLRTTLATLSLDLNR